MQLGNLIAYRICQEYYDRQPLEKQAVIGRLAGLLGRGAMGALRSGGKSIPQAASGVVQATAKVPGKLVSTAVKAPGKAVGMVKNIPSAPRKITQRLRQYGGHVPGQTGRDPMVAAKLMSTLGIGLPFAGSLALLSLMRGGGPTQTPAPGISQVHGPWRPQPGPAIQVAPTPDWSRQMPPGGWRRAMKNTDHKSNVKNTP